jgi:hypothetical protein
VPANDGERLVHGLLELLLGRPVESREYDRHWRAAAGSRPTQLAEWMSEEYERLIDVSAKHQYGPGAAARSKNWRQRHRSLTHLFAVQGFEAAARSVAVRVPQPLWVLLGAGHASKGSRPPMKGRSRRRFWTR